jgi:hypothetical protein
MIIASNMNVSWYISSSRTRRVVHLPVWCNLRGFEEPAAYTGKDLNCHLAARQMEERKVH